MRGDASSYGRVDSASVRRGKPALAQTAAVSSGSCPYWIDAATGAKVPTITIPATTGDLDYSNYRQSSDRNHISSTERGRTFVRPPDGSWIDAATGEQVPTITIPATTGDLDYSNFRQSSDRNHISSTERGRTFVLIPCPPSTASSTIGGYLGGELVKNWGWVRSTERLATTDVVTNQFSDPADPVGGGFLIGYKFAPWANNIIVSPFASFDFLNAPVNHTFPGGSYLGTTANFMGTGGVKIGPQLGGGVWLYGIAGVSMMNETLNINFIPVASSQSAWVAGGTVGVGGAFQPSFLQGFGHPVSCIRRVPAHMVAIRELQHASRFAAVQLQLRPAGRRGEARLYGFVRRTAVGSRAELSRQGPDAEVSCSYSRLNEHRK